jgi:chaperonin GroEL
MTHKMIFANNEELRQKILSGANTLADYVSSTLGPKGRTVLLKEKDKSAFATKDGVTVAQFVHLQDPFEDAGAQVIRQAANETNSNAGDGTTTATVLARAVLNESQRHIVAGVSPIEIQRGIDATVSEICGKLSKMATPVTSIEQIRHIATISANNDGTIGDLIAMAVDKVGQDGSITIEESRSLETSIDIMEGFRFPAGYCASAFVNDERRGIMQHEEPLVMVTDYKITQVEQILPILELVAREARPLIIVAEDIEGQALAAMIMNAMRGTLKIAAIKAPFYGQERRNLLSDLAISTGASFVTRESGKKIQEVGLADLGTAKSIESTKIGTIIVGGNCDFEAVENRIESLKSEIEVTEDFSECERIQGRIVRLSSGVAVIHVGGATQVEMTEKKHRVEDALEAVRSAQEEGIIGGGGTALLRASKEVEISIEHPDQAIGLEVVKSACEAPFRQMCRNAGISEDLLMKEVLDEEQNMGYNFRTDQLVDLYDNGILDPVRVTKTALKNAASCAGTLITTNYSIIQVAND